jgi:transposase InsO family protein
VSHLTSRKHELLFRDGDCFVFAGRPRRCVAHALKTAGGLYRLIARPTHSKEYANIANAPIAADINLLHHRLGHLGHDNVKRLVAKRMVEGVAAVGGRIELCEACIHGKQHRLPFHPSMKTARCKLDLIHTDICGPFPPSLGGKHYFVTFVDDHTCHVWVYLLREKWEVLPAFKDFKSLVENQAETTIKVLRSDGGGEYTSLELEGLLKAHGILHEKTAPYTPEQNGLAEIQNRTLVERLRAMLYEANLSKGCWGTGCYYYFK